jgi:hypothetical protein
MKGANVTTRIPIKIAEKLKSEARFKGISMSGCIMRILEKHYEEYGQDYDDDNEVLTRAEIQRRLENADDPRNCIAHGTDEEVIQYLRKIASEVI